MHFNRLEKNSRKSEEKCKTSSNRFSFKLVDMLSQIIKLNLLITSHLISLSTPMRKGTYILLIKNQKNTYTTVTQRTIKNK